MAPRYEWLNGGSPVSATVEEGILVSPLGNYLQSEEVAIATRSQARFRGMDDRDIRAILIQELLATPLPEDPTKEKYEPGDTYWQDVVDSNGKVHKHLSGSSF